MSGAGVMCVLSRQDQPSFVVALQLYYEVVVWVSSILRDSNQRELDREGDVREGPVT